MKTFIGILSALAILTTSSAMAMDHDAKKNKIDPAIVLGSTAVGCGLGYLVGNFNDYGMAGYNHAPKILGGCVAGAAVGALLVNFPEPNHAVDEAELREDAAEADGTFDNL